MTKGSTNRNPFVPLFTLLQEDYRANPQLGNPGLWAVWLHRLGNARMDVPRPWRAPLTVAYRSADWVMQNVFTTHLPYTVPWGRRSIIEHHTAVRINAAWVGNDVRIRHCTTLGNKGPGREDEIPSVLNGASIGAHTLIVGKITIGEDAMVGGGSVVTHDVAPGTTVAGIAAHTI